MLDQKQAAWLKKPYVEPRYLYHNILKEHPKPKLHINYSTLFCAFSIVAGLACAIFEGCSK